MIKLVVVQDVLEYLKDKEGMVYNHLEPDASYFIDKDRVKNKIEIETLDDIMKYLKNPKIKVYVPFANTFIEQNQNVNRQFLSFLIKHYDNIKGDLVLVTNVKSVPKEIEQYVILEEIEPINKEKIKKIIIEVFQDMFERLPEKSEEKLIDIASQKMQGLTESEVRNITYMSIKKFNSINEKYIQQEKLKNIKKKTDLEYDEPKINIEELGGLERIKTYIRILKDTMNEQAVKFGIKPPKGMLLIGPQGTAKSTIPKALSSYLGIPYIKFSPGSFMSKYYGESERMLYQVIKTIEGLGEAVIHIDEIDKVLKKTTDGHETTARISGMIMEWLAERDTMTPVVMTGNYVENIDTEFTRAGRIDTIFWTWFPKLEERKEIWNIHLRKVQRDPKMFDVDLLAEKSKFYTGSEIETAVQIALRIAFVNKKELKTEHLIQTLENYIIPIYFKEQPKFQKMYEDIQNFIPASNMENSDTTPLKESTNKRAIKF